MTKKELLARIEALEARVYCLEARQAYAQPTYVIPQQDPSPTWPWYSPTGVYPQLPTYTVCQS